MIAPLLAWRETVVKAVATLGFALILRALVAYLWPDDLRSIELPSDAVSITLLKMTDVARCLVGGPGLVMFDEPAGGLSVDETHRLGDLILGIHALTGGQTLVIDHDVELIARVCAEVPVRDFGRRIAFGPTADGLADPRVKAAYRGREEVGP